MPSPSVNPWWLRCLEQDGDDRGTFWCVYEKDIPALLAEASRLERSRIKEEVEKMNNARFAAYGLSFINRDRDAIDDFVDAVIILLTEK